jgi:bacteriocin biosynthesis cyclodehydratase domain-containing protein
VSSAPIPERPRICPIYDALYLPGRVWLGSGPAFASEVEDPDGRWAALIRLLDGSRDVEQLQRELGASLTASEVLEGIATLHEGGFLEDAVDAPPPELLPDELRRYAANINFFRSQATTWEEVHGPQSRLKRARVAVFGMGGIGSNVCMALAELGVGTIIGIDFDSVDLSNLNRQVLYSTAAVGRPKVEVAAERLNAFNPNIEFIGIQRKISSASDAAEILESADPEFVFCLADKPNGWIDFWINEACVRRGTPYSAGSISSHFGNAYSVIPGAGPCYRCIVDGEIAENPQFREVLDYVRHHNVSSSTSALGPDCMFMAYFLAREMLRSLIGPGSALASGNLLEINLSTFEQKWHPTSRRADCPVCSESVVTDSAGERLSAVAQ